DPLARLTITVCALIVRRPAKCAATSCSRRFSLPLTSGILTTTTEASISGEDHNETPAIRRRRLANGDHSTGRRQCPNQDRCHQFLFWTVCRHRRPDRQRHQALYETTWRHRRREEGRDYPQGHRWPESGCCQATRAGIDRA